MPCRKKRLTKDCMKLRRRSSRLHTHKDA
jgi:hypothetical protein